ncbi:MAG: UDP-galactopyranose mutase [Mycoplasmataceae bacterium]|nr:UDP-galactopyranose mutase [Mycoplasmataceae bacterium]
MKIKIIGAGLSGAVLARVLAENNFDIEIIEKRKNIGGNVFDEKINNITIHKYGPHIFHTSKKRVAEFMERFWTLNKFKNIVEGYIGDKLVPIPFNFKSIDICFPDQKEKIKNLLLENYKNMESVTIFELFENNDPIIKEVANFIYKNIFENYTIKMWDLNPKEIDSSVTSRIPVILSYKNTYFTDEYEGVPKEGYTKTIEKMLDHKNIKFSVNKNGIEYLKFENNIISFNNDKSCLIIYTGPLDELFDNRFGVLDYRSLNIKFEEINQEKFQNTAVVNFPAHPTMTRITEYKNMTFEKNEDITIISKEYPGKYSPLSKEFNEPYYPLATEKAREKYSQYKDIADCYTNLLLLGRLANYKYINMDQAIEDALIMAKKVIKMK